MKNKIYIFVLTLLLIALVVFVEGTQINNREKEHISFQLITENRTENINCWSNAEGKLYVFLPSYATMGNLLIHLPEHYEVLLEQQVLTQNMTCEDFKLDQWYELLYKDKKESRSYQLMFVQSENVATVYIDTTSGDMDYIKYKKGNSEAGEVSVYTKDGELNYSGVFESIKGRGNSTWEQYDKKPFSLELKEEADFLGMGQAKEWILLANADDPSHLRNKIVYDFARETGMSYVPDLQWVDLYLNDEYAGLYLLAERIEIEENRLELTEPDGTEDSSYIVSLEMEFRMSGQNEEYITTASGQTLRVNEPSLLTEVHRDTLLAEWQTIENAIVSEDGIDPNTGKAYYELIDVESWVNKYIVEEIFMSIDACYISQYFYSDAKSADTKVYAGPVWDFDHSMGREEQLEPHAFIANRKLVEEDVSTPWFNSLYHKDEFYNRIVVNYKEKYSKMLEEYIADRIPKYAREIHSAADIDKIRWNAYSEECIDSETKYIINFLTERKEFLDDVWIEGTEYCNICVDTGVNRYIYYSVLPGETIDELPILQGFDKMEFVGWYNRENGRPFYIDEPIYSDMEVYALWNYEE